MVRWVLFLAVVGVALATSGAAAAAPLTGYVAARCGALAHFDLGPTAHIESASLELNRATGPDVNWAGDAPVSTRTTLPAFCKLVVFSSPAPTSHIRIEVWLPLMKWNGRLLGTGNAGYPDQIEYQGMAAGLARGFAVVSTDLGLAAYLSGGKAAPERDITDIFIGNPVAIRDFASRATHEMTIIGKRTVQAFYGRPVSWSYFAGCSTGGMQAMSESQRFPEDYDAILAGDPGGNRVRVHLGILWGFLTVWHRPESVIPPDKLRLLHDAAVAECLRQEQGPTREQFLDRPQDCHWNPRSLACRGADGPACLTDGQMATALAIYSGPRNPRSREVYLGGLLPGSELGWAMFMKNATNAQVPYFGIFRAALGPALDPARFDWDRDARTFIDVMGPQLDSADPDITAFVRRGGKLLIYFGGADQLVPLTDAAAYRQAAIRTGHDRAPRVDVSQATQLLVIPGMDHCGGGLGPDRFDGLGAIQRWKENGIAPETIPFK
jgi:feruloyl esterase